MNSSASQVWQWRTSGFLAVGQLQPMCTSPSVARSARSSNGARSSAMRSFSSARYDRANSFQAAGVGSSRKLATSSGVGRRQWRVCLRVSSRRPAGSGSSAGRAPRYMR